MIYIVNGAPGAGKTTFENNVKTIMGGNFCKILSTIDFIKYIASKCGWNGEKTLKNRKFLSDLKDLLTDWNDIPFLKVKEQVQEIQNEWEYFDISPNKTAIFIDCREPQEIERLCKEFNAQSILITRESAEKRPTSNHADDNIMQYNYDIIIHNNGTLVDLAYNSIDFVDEQGLSFRSLPLTVDFFGNIEIPR